VSRCPNCFYEMPADRHMWVCSSGKCPASRDDTASKYSGLPVDKPPLLGVKEPFGAKKWVPPS
jgi:hypothetical protein